MKLAPRELDKLLIFTAARVAERRLKDGVKLNYSARITTCYLLPFFQHSSKVTQTLKLLPLGREKEIFCDLF
jgi:urease gamma subunit